MARRSGTAGETHRGHTGSGRSDDDNYRGDRKGRALFELKALGFDFLGAVIVLLIIVGGLYTYTGNWPPLVVVQSGSMQHSDTTSYVGVIDTGDLVFVKKIRERDRLISYVEGEAKDYRTYDSYGDVIIYKPNGEDDRTAIIHRAVVYLEWNDTTYDLPTPLFNMDDDHEMDLSEGKIDPVFKNYINSRLRNVNLRTIRGILRDYPDDENIGSLYEVYGGILDQTVSSIADGLYTFSDNAVVERVNTSRWSILESDVRMDIVEKEGSWTVYGYFKYGGGFDIEGGKYGYNQNDILSIDNYEWPREINDIDIDLGSIITEFRDQKKVPHSGYITKGDKNSVVDQNTHFDGVNQPSWIEPVEKEWVIGKSVGEVPWFGLIKLWIEGKSNPPQNSKTNLLIAIIVIIAIPFMIDLVYNFTFGRLRKDKDEEDKGEDEDRKAGKTPPQGRKAPSLSNGPPGRHKKR